MDCKASKLDQARFLRVRLEISLDKPLRRGGLVVSSEGDKVRVTFRYEWLVGWCFTCGSIGHELKGMSKSEYTRYRRQAIRGMAESWISGSIGHFKN